jgi:hypothetical protein
MHCVKKEQDLQLAAARYDRADRTSNDAKP